VIHCPSCAIEWRGSEDANCFHCGQPGAAGYDLTARWSSPFTVLSLHNYKANELDDGEQAWP
jgi:hypothetical protein